MATAINEISLKRDNGDPYCFQGHLFSECSYFDDENNCLTRQQLYVTDKGEQIYYVVRTIGKERERNIYRLNIGKDSCVINNGSYEIEMPFEHLMLAIRSLCGLTAEMLPSRMEMEEILRAANN